MHPIPELAKNIRQQLVCEKVNTAVPAAANRELRPTCCEPATVLERQTRFPDPRAPGEDHKVAGIESCLRPLPRHREPKRDIEGHRNRAGRFRPSGLTVCPESIKEVVIARHSSTQHSGVVYPRGVAVAIIQCWLGWRNW